MSVSASRVFTPLGRAGRRAASARRLAGTAPPGYARLRPASSIRLAASSGLAGQTDSESSVSLALPSRTAVRMALGELGRPASCFTPLGCTQNPSS